MLLRAVEFYVRRIPVERGKGRLLSVLGPLCAENDEFVLRTMSDGFRMELNPRDYIQAWLLFRGYYEPVVARFIRASVRPGMDVIDVGAHVGYITLLLSTLVDGTDVVHAFEPELRNRNHLLRHVRLNGLKNVNVRSEALSDRSGVVAFYPSRELNNMGLGSLRPQGSGPRAPVECETMRLDDYVRSVCPERGQRIGLIKIDVEGAEWLVLQGAEEVLATKPTLVLEFVEALAASFGYSSRDLLGWLQGKGYKCFQLAENGMTELQSSDVPRTSDIVCVGEAFNGE
jgi:FkbM family methyltransferase